MGDRKKRLAKPAALSAIAAASVVGAPSASAQVVCTPGVCETPPGANAFLKLSQLGLPGNTAIVFSKVEGKEIAFLKLTAMGLPGNTFDVFYKDQLG